MQNQVRFGKIRWMQWAPLSENLWYEIQSWPFEWIRIISQMYFIWIKGKPSSFHPLSDTHGVVKFKLEGSFMVFFCLLFKHYNHKDFIFIWSIDTEAQLCVFWAEGSELPQIARLVWVRGSEIMIMIKKCNWIELSQKIGKLQTSCFMHSQRRILTLQGQ